MLFSVLATYIKGQMKLSVRMKLPASSLLYSSLPAMRPNIRKRAVQAKPKSRQYLIDLSMALVTVWLFPFASASETMGSSRTEMELVSADGNRMRGRLIPVSTP